MTWWETPAFVRAQIAYDNQTPPEAPECPECDEPLDVYGQCPNAEEWRAYDESGESMPTCRHCDWLAVDDDDFETDDDDRRWGL